MASDYYRVTAGPVHVVMGNGDTHTFATNDLVAPDSEYYPPLAAIPNMLVDSGTPYTPTFSPPPPAQKMVDVTSSSVAPSAPTTDDLWYDTANKILKRWNGSSWDSSGSAASGVPVGGTTGQGLTKKTNADNDTQWSNLAQISSATPLANSAAGGAGSTGQASDAGHYHPAISIATQGIAQFMQSGRYYSFIGGGGTPGGVAQGTGECRLVPIWVDTNITVSSLSIEVTSSGVSAKQRLGIYGTTNGLPGTLLLDAGQADASTTGFKEITGLSLALTPGLYWLAQAAQGAVNSIRMITNGYTAGVAPTTLTTQPSAYRNDTITAALPGTFTLGTTPVASEGPRIWLKVA